MSLICDIIKDHKRDWKEYIEDKYPDIGFKCSERDPSLFIFKYGIGANFKDPVVCEARGIIIDVSVPKVVCFPFTKFGDFYESGKQVHGYLLGFLFPFVEVFHMHAN